MGQWREEAMGGPAAGSMKGGPAAGAAARSGEMAPRHSRGGGRRMGCGAR
jgi:hypothetical protein